MKCNLSNKLEFELINSKAISSNMDILDSTKVYSILLSNNLVNQVTIENNKIIIPDELEFVPKSEFDKIKEKYIIDNNIDMSDPLVAMNYTFLDNNLATTLIGLLNKIDSSFNPVLVDGITDTSKADLINKIVTISKNHVIENLSEEAVHVFTSMKKVYNNKHFQTALKEIINHPVYLNTLNSVKNSTKVSEYTLSNGELDFDKIKKEAVDKLLASYISGNYESYINQNKPGIFGALNRLYNFISSLIKQILPPIKYFNNDKLTLTLNYLSKTMYNPNYTPEDIELMSDFGTFYNTDESQKKMNDQEVRLDSRSHKLLVNYKKQLSNKTSELLHSIKYNSEFKTFRDSNIDINGNIDSLTEIYRFLSSISKTLFDADTSSLLNVGYFVNDISDIMTELSKIAGMTSDTLQELQIHKFTNEKGKEVIDITKVFENMKELNAFFKIVDTFKYQEKLITELLKELQKEANIDNNLSYLVNELLLNLNSHSLVVDNAQNKIMNIVIEHAAHIVTNTVHDAFLSKTVDELYNLELGVSGENLSRVQKKQFVERLSKILGPVESSKIYEEFIKNYKGEIRKDADFEIRESILNAVKYTLSGQVPEENIKLYSNLLDTTTAQHISAQVVSSNTTGDTIIDAISNIYVSTMGKFGGFASLSNLSLVKRLEAIFNKNFFKIVNPVELSKKMVFFNKIKDRDEGFYTLLDAVDVYVSQQDLKLKEEPIKKLRKEIADLKVKARDLRFSHEKNKNAIIKKINNTKDISILADLEDQLNKLNIKHNNDLDNLKSEQNLKQKELSAANKIFNLEKSKNVWSKYTEEFYELRANQSLILSEKEEEVMNIIRIIKGIEKEIERYITVDTLLGNDYINKKINEISDLRAKIVNIRLNMTPDDRREYQKNEEKLKEIDHKTSLYKLKTYIHRLLMNQSDNVKVIYEKFLLRTNTLYKLGSNENYRNFIDKFNSDLYGELDKIKADLKNPLQIESFDKDENRFNDMISRVGRQINDIKKAYEGSSGTVIYNPDELLLINSKLYNLLSQNRSLLYKLKNNHLDKYSSKKYKGDDKFISKLEELITNLLKTSTEFNTDAITDGQLGLFLDLEEITNELKTINTNINSNKTRDVESEKLKKRISGFINDYITVDKVDPSIYNNVIWNLFKGLPEFYKTDDAMILAKAEVERLQPKYQAKQLEKDPDFQFVDINDASILNELVNSDSFNTYMKGLANSSAYKDLSDQVEEAILNFNSVFEIVQDKNGNERRVLNKFFITKVHNHNLVENLDDYKKQLTDMINGVTGFEKLASKDFLNKINNDILDESNPDSYFAKLTQDPNYFHNVTYGSFTQFKYKDKFIDNEEFEIYDGVQYRKRDLNGNYLPKVSGIYKNQVYFDLKKNDPETVKTLENFRKEWFAIQATLPKGYKLDNKLMAKNKDSSEIQAELLSKEGKNVVSYWADYLKGFFNLSSEFVDNMRNEGELTPEVYDPLTNELIVNVNVKPPGLGRIDYRNQSMNLFSMIIDYNQRIHDYNSKSELESIYRLMKESVKHNKIESDYTSKNTRRTEILEKKLNYEIYNHIPTEGFNDPRIRRIINATSQTGVLLAFTALNQTANALTPRIIAIERYYKQNKHNAGWGVFREFVFDHVGKAVFAMKSNDMSQVLKNPEIQLLFRIGILDSNFIEKRGNFQNFKSIYWLYRKAASLPKQTNELISGMFVGFAKLEENKPVLDGKVYEWTSLYDYDEKINQLVLKKEFYPKENDSDEVKTKLLRFRAKYNFQDGTEFVKMYNYTYEELQNQQGNHGANSKSLLDFTIGGEALKFKRHMGFAFINNYRKDKYNHLSGTYEKGGLRYILGGSGILNFIEKYKAAKKDGIADKYVLSQFNKFIDNSAEFRAVKGVGFKMTLIYLVLPLLFSLLGFDDDDDNKWDHLNDDEFSKEKAQMLYVFMKLQAEISSSIVLPVGGLGTKEFLNWAGSPFQITTSFSVKVYEIIRELLYNSKYKNDGGKNYKREGDSKAKAKFIEAIGWKNLVTSDWLFGTDGDYAEALKTDIKQLYTNQKN